MDVLKRIMLEDISSSLLYRYERGRTMGNGRPLLEINALHTAFHMQDNYYDAVDDVSFSLEKNEILAIVGESGCGKSTLATTIVGLHNKVNTRISGEIIYQNLNLIDLNETLYNRIRGNDIGMVFQDPLSALNPLMTVSEQIEEVLLYHSKMTKEERELRVCELLIQVKVDDPKATAARYPHELSWEARQRVGIAIAIACEPPIIIADEPTTSLDVTVQARILDLLSEVRDETGAGIILITHDLGVVAEIADRVAVMYAGQIVESAGVVDLFTDPKHPYTRSLLRSMPQMKETCDPDAGELYVIQGDVPSLQQLPKKGCRFAERIPWVPFSAHEESPKMHEVSKGHFVRCTCHESFQFEGESD